MEKIYRQSLWAFVPDIIWGIILPVASWPFILIHVFHYFQASLRLGFNGVVIRKGIIAANTIEIPYKKINNIIIRQGIIGRIFSYGDITILSGNDMVGEKFKKIVNPYEIKLFIQQKDS